MATREKTLPADTARDTAHRLSASLETPAPVRDNPSLGVMSGEGHPLASVFGALENDPMLDAMMARVAEYRARMDAAADPAE